MVAEIEVSSANKCTASEIDLSFLTVSNLYEVGERR